MTCGWPPYIVIALIIIMLIAALICGASIAVAIRLGDPTDTDPHDEE